MYQRSIPNWVSSFSLPGVDGYKRSTERAPKGASSFIRSRVSPSFNLIKILTALPASVGFEILALTVAVLSSAEASTLSVHEIVRRAVKAMPTNNFNRIFFIILQISAKISETTILTKFLPYFNDWKGRKESIRDIIRWRKKEENLHHTSLPLFSIAITAN